MQEYAVEFRDILDDGEALLWVDKPNKFAYIMGSFTQLMFGLVWGLFDVLFLVAATSSGDAPWFLYAFLLVHSFPCWSQLYGFVVRSLSYKNVWFGYTSKRIILKSGLMGIDYKVLDYDGIKKMEVNVSPLEKLLGVGSIVVDQGVGYGGGQSGGHRTRLYGIREPYKVFKELKRLSLDVKTDIYYPNDLRPETNSGYNTKYTPR